LLGAPAIVDEVLIEAVGWFAGVPGGGSSGPIRPQPVSASARNVREKRHKTRNATAGSKTCPYIDEAWQKENAGSAFSPVS
jgi:hypothetical protein